MVAGSEGRRTVAEPLTRVSTARIVQFQSLGPAAISTPDWRMVANPRSEMQVTYNCIPTGSALKCVVAIITASRAHSCRDSDATWSGPQLLQTMIRTLPPFISVDLAEGVNRQAGHSSRQLNSSTQCCWSRRCCWSRQSSSSRQLNSSTQCCWSRRCCWSNIEFVQTMLLVQTIALVQTIEFVQTMLAGSTRDVAVRNCGFRAVHTRSAFA